MDIRYLGAAREVTGSCYLIRTGPYHLLIDCGLIQGSPQDEERNRAPFPFDLGNLGAVILTHSHLDHSGRLPMLVKEGFKGPIFSHSASRDLCRIMLKDAAYLNEKETVWENRKRQRSHKPLVEPIYTMREAVVSLRRFRPLNYDQEYEILPGVRLRLRDAGHILGSSIVELWLEERGKRESWSSAATSATSARQSCTTPRWCARRIWLSSRVPTETVVTVPGKKPGPRWRISSPATKRAAETS